jgi:hypothetical protein
MTELSSQLLLDTATATITDVVCHAACGHRSAEECARATHLVFPYRGVFVRHVGRTGDAVAEAARQPHSSAPPICADPTMVADAKDSDSVRSAWGDLLRLKSLSER